MKKHIVAFDIETTGLNKKIDHIIQLSAVKLLTETLEIIDEKSWYVIPPGNFTITQSAYAVHGITKEFLLENGRPLKDVAREFNIFADECDILTYNGNRFDVQFLHRDFNDVGEPFLTDHRTYYDSFALECRIHPRDLSTVYLQRTGKLLEGAHDAQADIMATIEVFRSQVKELNNDDSFKLDKISEFEECNLFCLEGSLRKANKIGERDKIVFSVGKYTDSEFIHICKTDPSYIQWFYGTLSDETKQFVRDYYNKNKDFYS